MKPIDITWKSTLPTHTSGSGVEYRVLFEEIPEYLKEAWKGYAYGICSEEEIKNPRLEMEAIYHRNGSLEDVCFKYYFDDYEEFELKENDHAEAISMFVDYIRKHGKGLPDAYNNRTGELMGDGDWISARDKLRENKELFKEVKTGEHGKLDTKIQDALAKKGLKVHDVKEVGKEKAH